MTRALASGQADPAQDVGRRAFQRLSQLRVPLEIEAVLHAANTKTPKMNTRT